MSAWPEAVWLKNEINAALGMDQRLNELNERLLQVEHRYLFISQEDPRDAGGVSAGSIWAKVL